VSDLERLRWNDEELEGEGFASWTPYDHPQLGKVEIGGWRRRFTARNPPLRFLRDECALYVPWMVWLAQQSPLLEIREVAVARLDAELSSGSKRLDLGHIKGSRDTAGPQGRHESRRSLEWVVRKTGPRAALTVVAVSEKGGTARREVELR
jgi:hypothetical protein